MIRSRSNSRTAFFWAALLTLATSCDRDRLMAPPQEYKLTPSTEVTGPPAMLIDATCPAGATKWLTATNGNWTDATRWSAGVPTAATSACIDLPGTYTVTFNAASPLTTQRLFIGGPGAAAQPTLRNVRGSLVVTTDVAVHGRIEIAPGPGNTARYEVGGTIAVAATGTIASSGTVGGSYDADAIENEGTVATAVVTNFRTNRFRNAGTVSISGSFGLRVSANTAPPDVDFESGSVTIASRYDQTGGTLDITGGTLSGTTNLFAPIALHLAADNGGRFNIGSGETGISQVTGTIGASQHVFIGGATIAAEVPTSLVNNGLITISSSPGLGQTPALMRTTGDGTLTNAAGGTITMLGSLGAALEGSILNEGLITHTSHASLRAKPLVNRGTIRVSQGLSLNVRGPDDATPPVVVLEEGLVDVSGTMTLFDGDLTVNGGAITGIVRVDPPGRLTLNGNTGGQFNLLGGSANEGTRVTQVDGTVGATEHVLVGTANLSAEVSSSLVNNGQITISSSPGVGQSSVTLRTIDGGTITNAASGTITFQGSLGPTLAGSIVNEGLITNVSHAVLRPNPLVNRGVVRVAQGLQMNANTPAEEPAPVFINDGGSLEAVGSYNQTRGRFEHRNGTVSGAGATTFNAVRFSGFGTWQRALALTGASIMAPGASPGLIAISGNYTPSTTAVTEIELAGNEPGTGYDQIAVANNASFAGALAVTLTDGFIPRPCQTFTVMTYATRTAMFSNAATPIDVGGGMRLRQVYTPSALILVAYSANGPNVNPTEITVSMEGATAAYDVCIGAAAAADVVTVSPDAQVVVDTATLTFGASQLPQTVTVSASPTATRTPAFITHTASSGVPVATVKVNITGIRPSDSDPPTTIATATPGPNANGWNRTDVTVALHASDAGSGVAEIVWTSSGAQNGSATVSGGAATVNVTAEGMTTLTYFARDGAGNEEPPGTLAIRIDKTAPQVDVTRDPANMFGWNNTDVTAIFAGSDALSGINGPAIMQVVFSAEGANQGVTRSFADRAGNMATGTVGGISIDKTRPTVTVTRQPPPNADGWNNTPVTATFTATDQAGLSGIDGVPVVQVVFDQDGANQSATRTFRDRAGNVETATISGVSIGRTPPALSCSVNPQEIWPPNDKLVPVKIVVAVTGGASFTLVRVSNNEPEANDVVDFVIGTPDTEGQVRASRRGGGTGRVYQFEYRGFDAAGNAAVAVCEIRVPHDRGQGKR